MVDMAVATRVVTTVDMVDMAVATRVVTTMDMVVATRVVTTVDMVVATAVVTMAVVTAVVTMGVATAVVTMAVATAVVTMVVATAVVTMVVVMADMEVATAVVTMVVATVVVTMVGRLRGREWERIGTTFSPGWPWKDRATVTRLLRSRNISTTTCHMISVFGKRLAGTTSLASAGSTSTGTSRISTVWPPLFLQSSPGQARWANVGATPPATSISTFLNVSTAQRIGPPSPTSSARGPT